MKAIAAINSVRPGPPKRPPLIWIQFKVSDAISIGNVLRKRPELEGLRDKIRIFGSTGLTVDEAQQLEMIVRPYYYFIADKIAAAR